MRAGILAATVVAAAAAVAACGSSSSGGSAGGTSSAAPASCSNSAIQGDLYAKGALTVATDKPAYPPWFESNDPANGKGYESAVTYAVARQLGFTRGQVHWTYEPFNDSYAPGPRSSTSTSTRSRTPPSAPPP